MKLCRREKVRLKGGRVLPSGLSRIVVVNGAVYHGLEWFVVFSVDNEFSEFVSQKSGCGVNKRSGMLNCGRMVLVPLFIDHVLPLICDWLIW